MKRVKVGKAMLWAGKDISKGSEVGKGDVWWGVLVLLMRRMKDELAEARALKINNTG